ncbi:MAG: hypothetical protein ACJ8DZ_11005, partial [Allosphingosinicella sp.]
AALIVLIFIIFALASAANNSSSTNREALSNLSSDDALMNAGDVTAADSTSNDVNAIAPAPELAPHSPQRTNRPEADPIPVQNSADDPLDNDGSNESLDQE